MKNEIKGEEPALTIVIAILLMMLTAALITISGCAASNKAHYEKINGLHNSGTYTVKARSGNTVSFKEVAGKYTIANDTLKVGDKISVNVIKKSNYNLSNKN